jgi:hypothetical protein
MLASGAWLGLGCNTVAMALPRHNISNKNQRYYESRQRLIIEGQPVTVKLVRIGAIAGDT